METITIGEKFYSLLMERESLMQEANNFLDEHEDADGRLSAKDTAQYKQLRRKIDRLTTEIEVEGRKPMPHPDLRPNPGADPFSAPITNQRAGVVGNSYRKGFFSAIRTGFKVANEYLREGVLSDGGYLCPVEFDNQIVSALEQGNVLRQISRIITTQSAHKIPLVSAKPAASWIGEGEKINLSAEQFGQVSLEAHKLAVAILASSEILQDAFVDIEAFLAQEFSDALARAEEEAFLNGTGEDNQPLGLLPAMAQSASAFLKTTGATITPDDLITLEFSLDRPYRRAASWLTSEATLAQIRKFKDNTSNYIWQPSLTSEEADKLFGYPVYTTPYFPPATSGNPCIVFGDFSRFVIGDRGNRTFRPLHELYALSDQSAFLMLERVDCALVDHKAFRGLKIK